MKRAGYSDKEIVSVYTCILRSMLEYAAPVWHPGLTLAQSKTLESIQKRVLKIVYPEESYNEALELSNLTLLSDRRSNLCKKLFHSMQDANHKLNHLLVMRHGNEYQLRNPNKYELPICRTDRYKKSFIPYCLYNLQ